MHLKIHTNAFQLNPTMVKAANFVSIITLFVKILSVYIGYNWYWYSKMWGLADAFSLWVHSDEIPESNKKTEFMWNSKISNQFYLSIDVCLLIRWLFSKFQPFWIDLIYSDHYYPAISLLGPFYGFLLQ